MTGIIATILFFLPFWGLWALVHHISTKLKEARRARRALVENVIKLHIAVLSLKRRQLVLVDDYGTERDAGWRKEVTYFLQKAVQVAGVKNFDFSDDQWAWGRINELVSQTQIPSAADAQTVQAMDPLAFEEHCAELLRQAGWNARRTQASGDQGVDVIAEKGGRKVVLQCKLYGQPVGNSAVQAVESGRIFYEASVAAVVSNATFTLSARRLAASTGTLLLHHSELGRLEEAGGRSSRPAVVEPVQINDPRAPVKVPSKPIPDLGEIKRADAEIVAPADRVGYLAYWQALVDQLRHPEAWPNGRSPSRNQNWMHFRTGVSGIVYAPSFAHSGRARAELGFVDGAHDVNKGRFDILAGRRVEFETAFGEALSWERLEGKTMCRIACYRPGSIDSDPAGLDEIRAWHADRLLRFKRVFGPHLASLPVMPHQ